MDGKFVLEESPLQSARAEKEKDLDKLKSAPSLQEISTIIKRILIRLEALEK
jgi:hypothetical protein